MAEAVTISPHYHILDPRSEISKAISGNLTWFGPKFSPKDVPRFYDISSLCENAHLFQKVIDVMAARYLSMPKERQPTHVLGFDARGFLLGTPLALALKVPFVMMRKAAKTPGLLYESSPYHKEYAEAKPDTMAIRQDAIHKGARVLLLDDLIATGGTAISGFELIAEVGAEVVEFAAIIGIPFLNGVAKIHEYMDGRFKDVDVFTLVHDDSITDATCGDPKDFTGASRIVQCTRK
eukprot:GILI01010658.1.p1 GENE.GILI01010658.1~~GILI01010658.1.p1  ORF type:complete len:248 (+),score=46.19 GILI01010658.1:37-744(+)